MAENSQCYGVTGNFPEAPTVWPTCAEEGWTQCGHVEAFPELPDFLDRRGAKP